MMTDEYEHRIFFASTDGKVREVVVPSFPMAQRAHFALNRLCPGSTTAESVRVPTPSPDDAG